VDSVDREIGMPVAEALGRLGKSTQTGIRSWTVANISESIRLLHDARILALDEVEANVWVLKVVEARKAAFEKETVR